MRLLTKINYRIFLTALMIVLQFILAILMLFRIVNYVQWIGLALTILSIAVVIFLNMKEDNASYKIGWIILILSLPLFGGLFYLFFGNKRPSKSMRLALNKEHNKILPYLDNNKEILDEFYKVDNRAAAISKYIHSASKYPIYKNTYSKYYPLGEEMFEDILVEMNKAKEYIFFEFFIIEEGYMWEKMLKVLKSKVKDGVDVRMIYDDVGSLFLLPNNFTAKMEAMDIKCLSFNRFRPFLSAVMNHRNHRKILIIDGKTAFTGGINIADEYINLKERFGHWKDTGIMLKGESVWSFVIMFTEIWNAFRNDKIDIEKLHREEDLNNSSPIKSFVQPYADSPLDNEPLGENIYIEILSQAKDYVYIFTPYLIIDNELQSALQLAAKRGVDVRIITPGIPDKKITFRITRTNYPPLLNSGVRIYEYTPGFMHAKSFISDDKLGVVGTINMDYRSLYLHFECGVFIYSKAILENLKDDSIETIKLSKEITLDDINQGLFSRIVDSILRLFAILF